MYSYRPSALPNTRVDAADLLRGVAVAGIILIHFIEHLNFYSFPPLTQADEVTWDVVFFLLSNKMYAIFAMLFGLTFFIQHDNQAKRGYDFRPRFAWRMVLLFMFGLLDLVFYNGDILTVYAVGGLLVLPLVRASDKVVAAVAAVLALQPIELVYFIGGMADPQLQPLNLGSAEMFEAILPAQADGSLLDVAKAGLLYGLPVNFAWAIEHGRFTQTLFLFLLGMLVGRQRAFVAADDGLVGRRLCRAVSVMDVSAGPGCFRLRPRLAHRHARHVEEPGDDAVLRQCAHVALLPHQGAPRPVVRAALRQDELD